VKILAKYGYSLSAAKYAEYGSFQMTTTRLFLRR